MRNVNPRTLSNTALADKVGALNARIAALKEQENALKADFLRRGFASIDGNKYRLTRVEARTDFKLDTTLIREIMPKRWLDEHSKACNVEPYALVKAITGKRNSKPVPANANVELVDLSKSEVERELEKV